MAYFVYKIRVGTELTMIDQFPNYRDARARVRDLRKAASTDKEQVYRLIFANDTDQAEQLLLEKREPRPMGEHD